MLWVVAAIIKKIALRGTASYFYVSPAETAFLLDPKVQIGVSICQCGPEIRIEGTYHRLPLTGLAFGKRKHT